MKNFCKKILNKTYFRNYFIMVLCFSAIEVIFKLVSEQSLLEYSSLRIFLGLNIVAGLISFCLNFIRNNVVKKVIIGILVFALATYSCAEMGFYNFIGVYMSIQTSSQLDEVVDYILDFVKSFKAEYFLVYIPFVVYIVQAIFFNRKRRDKLNFKHNIEALLIVLAVCVPAYYFTVVGNMFQDQLQSVSNKNLFLTASNPSLTVKEYGAFGFVFLDIKTALFPVEIEEEASSPIAIDIEEIMTPEKTEEEEEAELQDDNARVVDDTAWKELINKETNKTFNTLNSYFINRPITPKNDKTGLFEGKNLVIILMESVNDIIYDENYYPNFAKMIKGGWSWENNYSPRNACATMNNEFSGMTSLYSIIKTCTASKYKSNKYYESVFNLFNNQNYNTFSVHDYTDAYYPRKTIHPNMGSAEYYGANKLGIKYSNEYINWANDDEAMEAFMKILDKKTANGEHFMSWFTTVSSHQPYGVDSKQGNAYYDMTKGTKYPADVRRFMSKLKFVDNALGVLLDGLEERGMLEDTVIVLYGDHYPYGISTNNLNKVLDYDTKKDKNAEQVPFVIYNAGTTDGTVFKEYTSYMNILPTLANLFNLDYDPRLYLGYDLFSEDAVSLTVFADGSWKNEVGYYDASKNKVNYYGDKKYTPEEIKAINKDINNKMAISEKAIENNYFNYLKTKLDKIKADQLNLKCADFSCENPLVAVTTTKKKDTVTTTTKKKVTTKDTTTTTTKAVVTSSSTTTSTSTTTTTTTTTTTVAVKPNPETDEEENNN